MNIEMPVVEFSDEVRARAHALSRSPKPVHAVSAIANSGLHLDMAQYYAQAGHPSKYKVNQCLAIEQVQQKALEAAGIVDDATAIAYLNKVRPIMEGWTAQLDELRERQAAEIRDLVNGWVDL